MPAISAAAAASTTMPSVGTARNPAVADSASPDAAAAKANADGAQDAGKDGNNDQAAKDGVKVDISDTGKALSTDKGGKADKKQDRNADIEGSNLPDQVKKLLVRIRELRAQLEEKVAQLQAVMSEQGLTSDQRLAKATGLKQAVQTVTGSLNDASGMLNNALHQMHATPDQAKLAATLAAA